MMHLLQEIEDMFAKAKQAIKSKNFEQAAVLYFNILEVCIEHSLDTATDRSQILNLRNQWVNHENGSMVQELESIINNSRDRSIVKAAEGLRVILNSIEAETGADETNAILFDLITAVL